MNLKDMIKKCDFWELVANLAKARADAGDKYDESKESFEDALLEIMNLPECKNSGMVQTVQASSGEFLHFYINDTPAAQNETLIRVDWRKITHAELRTLKLDDDEDYQDRLSKEDILEITSSIVYEMTMLKFTNKEEK